MANIADIMLNRRMDSYAAHVRALDPDHDWYPPHRRALEAEAARLRPICLRGLTRCYPAMADSERAAMLDRHVALYQRPRDLTDLGGGYILTGSR